MSEFVHLDLKRNRGWPWPPTQEGGWGLTPMFGEDGWCHSCGVPRHPQTGSIVMQRGGIKVEGAWVPNWQFDVICLGAPVAAAAESRFALDLRKVDWHPAAPTREARQIVVPTVGESWFDHDELRAKAIERHGVAGRTCGDCGVWRWMPLAFPSPTGFAGLLPPLRITPGLGDDVDIAGSPEWFGDGWLAFRQILVRRELAELIATASRKDFSIQSVV